MGFAVGDCSGNPLIIMDDDHPDGTDAVVVGAGFGGFGDVAQTADPAALPEALSEPAPPREVT